MYLLGSGKYIQAERTQEIKWENTMYALYIHKDYEMTIKWQGWNNL